MKPRGRVWENRETMLLLQKLGGGGGGWRKYTDKTIVLYKKEAYMTRNNAFVRAVGYEDRNDDACKTYIHW